MAATSAKPGVVLKRPVGSNGPSTRNSAELPRDLAGDGGAKKAARMPPSRKPQKHAKKIDEAEDRKAALAFEKEQARRERERAKEEAAQRKQREQRAEGCRQGASGSG